MLRKDLEDQISAKLVSLSNEDAQRVAEEYVRILYPSRFPFFAFRAFSPEGKSRSGWPDAAYVGADGKIEGVEATHTANRSGVVAHLEEYLAKAGELGADQLGGFVHISVSPKAAFEPQEIKNWTNKFVEAGFKADRVELVFGQTLVNTLTRPEFARTRVEVLGIEDLPTCFSLYRSKVGPDEKRLGTRLIPSWEDFESGRIHRPELAKTVTEALSRDRVALVRGIGASGKTVMAWLLAQDVLAKGLPAYSFDFVKLQDEMPDLVNLLISEMKRFSHPDVLFVVDNIHIDEVSAKVLYLAWGEIPHAQRPQLLLIGRETRTAKGSAIESLHMDPLPLRARQPELRGVFRRLALRHNTDEQVPEPTDVVLADWLSIFGGAPENPETTADLIAFSAAVTRRLSDLCRGQWKLAHGDAIEEVKQVYLRELSARERENLIRVCVAQGLELAVPSDTLADQSAELAKCNGELGIVFRDEYGKRGQYVRYRLAHAALGQLLLSAEPSAVNRTDLLSAMAMANPKFGAVTAIALARIGKQDDAKMLFELLLQEPETLLKFDDVHEIYLLLRRAGAFDVPVPAGLDALLAIEKEYLRRLTEIALHTPLHFLTAFLRYAEKSLPQTFTALETALSDAENFPDLVDAALHTPLGDLTTFLRYAEKSLPQTFAALENGLADPEKLPSFVDMALRPALDQLSTFFWYADASMPTIFRALKKDLDEPSKLARFVNPTLQTPIVMMLAFLRCAQVHLPNVFLSLASHLSSDEGKLALSEKMSVEAIDALVSALRGDILTAAFEQALSKIDLSAWEISRAKAAAPKIDAFVAFQKIAYEHDRADLLSCVALRIVEKSTYAQWNSHNLGLHHFSHIIRLANNATVEQRRNFVLQVATPEWLDARYESTPNAGLLAGNMFALATFIPEDLYHHFNREPFRNRIVRELRSAHDSVSRAGALSLLGAADFLKVECDTNDVPWPNAKELEEVLRLRAPAPDRESIGVMEVQLWLGLRVMATQLETPPPVPAELGDRVLELWQASQAQIAEEEETSEKVIVINETVIPWLELCKSNDWELVPPHGTN